MKNRNNFKTFLIYLSILALSGFSVIQITQKEEQLIGSWTFKNESNNKWIFTETYCKWEYNGKLIESFTYEVSEEKSTNGKLTFSILKLVNVNDVNDVYKYDINALGDDKMALDYLGDMNTKLMFFTKE